MIPYLNIAGLNISNIVLGSSHFGAEIDDTLSLKMIDLYYEKGGRTLDTARSYGGWIGNYGASEKVIGQWIKNSVKRKEIIVITKGAHYKYECPNNKRLNYIEIKEDIEYSLETLQTDYIDLYFLHRDDPDIPVSEIIDIMDEFKNNGYFYCFGASNWQTKRIDAAIEYNRQRGTKGFCCSQIQWSLLQTTPDKYGDTSVVCMNKNEYDWYKDNSFPIMAYGVLSNGYLLNRLSNVSDDLLNTRATQRYKSYNNEQIIQYFIKENLTIEDAVRMSLAYVCNNIVPAVAVIGCSNMLQLTNVMNVYDKPIKGDKYEYEFR